MDRVKRAANVIKDINGFRNNNLKDYDLIKTVCSYFDEVKQGTINQADLHFLKHISNIVGIPHFYDLLSNFGHDTSLETFDLNTFSSILHESTLHTNERNKVHRYQKKIMDLYELGKLNRYFLSASTSFGKTHIVYEIIKKMNYNNVVLIFPTIALLTENYEKIISDENYEYFRTYFTIHTLSEISEFGSRNLFIFTPERFLSYIDKHRTMIDLDFIFIDEVYKIDNEYEIDDETKENERDVAYRLAAYYTLKYESDVLLAGPYVEFSKPEDVNYNSSFSKFLSSNKIQLIDYNEYEIVNKSFIEINSKSDRVADYALSFNFTKSHKDKMLIEIIRSMTAIIENTIIYCPKKIQVEGYAKKIVTSGILNNHDCSEYQDFIDHVSKHYDKEWILIQALKHGIGMHHGLVPKYIQKEIISLFNINRLKVLIATTTITEGVNTSAKNLIVLDSFKGNKQLKKFDAKNIAGRAGRFLYHYSGRVIVLKNNFMELINSESIGIKHKNYDTTSQKDEIDLFYTDDVFLNEGDRSRINKICLEQAKRNIPDQIFDQYKVISRSDKIQVYDEICKLSNDNLESISKLIQVLNYKMDINYAGFQVIINTIEPIVKNKNLKFLIAHKNNYNHSVLTNLVHYFLLDGFMGLVKYRREINKESADTAIRKTADFVYNTLKYHVVKYLGVFNIMYKLYLSSKTSQAIDSIQGIDKLLVMFEYNALSNEGRVASDYGVPANVVKYYEVPTNSAKIKNGFDQYESSVFKKIDRIISNIHQ